MSKSEKGVVDSFLKSQVQKQKQDWIVDMQDQELKDLVDQLGVLSFVPGFRVKAINGSETKQEALENLKDMLIRFDAKVGLKVNGGKQESWVQDIKDRQTRVLVESSGITQDQFSQLKDVVEIKDQGQFTLTRSADVLDRFPEARDNSELLGQKIKEEFESVNKEAVRGVLKEVIKAKLSGKGVEEAVKEVKEVKSLSSNYSILRGEQVPQALREAHKNGQQTLEDQTTSTQQKASMLTKIAESVSNLKLPVARSFGRYVVAMANYINSGFGKEKGQEVTAARKNFVAQVKNMGRSQGW